MRRMIVLNIIGFVVLVIAALGIGVYIYDTQTYVSTDNAHVAVRLVSIRAPFTSTLKTWNIQVGSTVQAGATVGAEVLPQPSGATVAPLSPTSATTGKTSASKGTASSSKAAVNVKPHSVTMSSLVAPTNGTILETTVVPNMVVSQGQTLAIVGDLSQEYLIAYINEKDIRHVSVGKSVTFYLDAYPGTKFTGQVTQIDNVAGDVLSPLASSDAKSGASQVKQRVPIEISVDSFQGQYVVPGMNATIQIHR